MPSRDDQYRPVDRVTDCVCGHGANSGERDENNDTVC
jgi:hypothetical protein